MTDVFDQTPTPNTPPQTDPAPSNNPFEDKLKAIVNEQGQPKYKDVVSALDALKASQEHIKRLEDEAKARQAMIDNAVAEKTRADALEEIVQRLSNNSQRPPQVDPPTVGVDEAAVVKTLEKLLEQKEVQAQTKNNITSVQNALIAKFGDAEKTKQAVAAKAAELGTTSAELGALSAKNPQLVLTLFGLVADNKGGTPTSPTASPLNPPQAPTQLQRPEKSLLSGPGATDKNRREMMAKIRDEVYKKYNVETI